VLDPLQTINTLYEKNSPRTLLLLTNMTVLCD